MSILWVGTSLDQFEEVVATTDASAAGTYNDTVLNMTSQNQLKSVDLGINLSNHWFHHAFTSGANDPNTRLISFFNASNVEIIRCLFTGSSIIQIQTWNGTVWVNQGTASTSIGSGAHDYDIYLDLDVAGNIEVYVDGVLRTFATGDFSAVAGVRQAGYSKPQSNFTILMQQCIIADEATLGMRYYSKRPTSNGSETAWANDYTQVDETPLDRTDTIYSATANQIETFRTAARTGMNGNKIVAVIVTAEVAKGMSGPSQVQLVLNKGGTNYTSPSKALTYGFKGVQGIWHTDPSNGLEWTAADAADAGLEFGLKSIT